MSLNPTIYVDTVQGARLLAPLDWISLEYARQETEVGALTLTLPYQDYGRELFPKDGLIEVWNNLETGGTSLELETVWLMRRVRYLASVGVWEITAYDLNHLLKRRLIDYNPGNTYTEKLGTGDDVGKDLVSENLGAGATDTTRSIATYLSIQSKVSAAASVRISCSRQEVLKTLQDIASSSYQQGTYLAFDTVVTQLPGQSGPNLKFEFRSYTGQRGVDRRGQIYLGPDFGNLIDVEVDEDASAEVTRAISTGQGVDNALAVQRVDDLARWESSPFGLMEGSRQASNALTATDLLNDARALLKQGVPIKTISGKLVSQPGVEYNVDWGWGDRVEVQVRGIGYICRVTGIHVTYTREGREVEPTLTQVTDV